MADLIEKFFQEDLSEAEEKALSDELVFSEETALRLGEKAEQAYARLGLPEPIWPDSAGTIPHVTKTIPWNWVWFWAVLAGMIGATAWWCFSHKGTPPAPSASLTRPSSIEMPRIIPRDDLPKTSVAAVTRKKPVQAAVPAGIRKPALETRQPPLAEPPAVSETFNAYPPPLNLDESPGRSYSSLSVEVRRSTPGFLTVRVLNAQGSEVVLLYRGDLKAGNWVFEWNGRLVDGRMAAPGSYQIEVQTGSFAQRKAIQIK
jgi:hypothetical protein